MGEEATRRRWGERWYQVRIEPVTAEIRLEGDNAIDLGRGLCCDAVAKLDAQIDTAKDLEQSIAKIVKHFICVPTNDRDLILGQAAFGEPLKNVLRSMMKNVIGIVSYREMLDNPDCIVKLQEELKKQMGEDVKQGTAILNSQGKD